ncbi:MAG: NAD(P)/FAD-dependent oxidoreductase [Candidatus Geothermincolia bacterium]
MHDVIIVGAGCAGCIAATRLAARGRSVLLLDARSRADIGNPWVNDVERSVFPRLNLPMPSGPETLPMPRVTRFTSPSGRHAIELRGVDATMGVRMDAFTKRLLEGALSSGVEFRDGTTCEGPLLEGGAVRGVIADGEAIPAKVVVDASGWQAVVRNGLPESSPVPRRLDPKYLVTAWREERGFSPDEAEEVPRRFGIEPDVNVNRLGWRGGYSVHTLHWDPRERVLDSLVGYRQAASPQSAREYLAEFLAERGMAGEKLYGGGGLIPVRRSLDVLVDDGFVLAGDSACMVIPAHGSGVASSLIAGDLAASTIDRCLARSDTSKEALWEYCAAYQRDRGSLMAYFEASRLISENLDVERIEWLIGYVLTAGDMDTALRAETLKLHLKDTLERVKGLRHPLFTGRSALLASMALVMRHLYKRYPERYDRSELEAWRAKVGKVVRLLGEG